MPVLQFLLQHTQRTGTVEEMDALVEKVADEFQVRTGPSEKSEDGKAKKETAKEPPKSGGKYLGGEGQSLAPKGWAQMTKEERAKTWKEFKSGDRPLLNWKPIN